MQGVYFESPGWRWQAMQSFGQRWAVVDCDKQQGTAIDSGGQ